MYVRLKHQQSQNNNREIPENGCGHWKFQKILVGVGLHIQYVQFIYQRSMYWS